MHRGRGVLVALLAAGGCGGRGGSATDGGAAELCVRWDIETFAREVGDVEVDDAGNVVVPACEPIVASPCFTRYSPTGEVLATFTLTCSMNELAIHPSGDVLIAGAVTRDCDAGGMTVTATGGTVLYTARIGPDLRARWVRTYPAGGGANVFDVSATPDGDLLVGGDFTTSVDFGTGPLTVSTRTSDIFVARLSGDDGAARWARAIAGSETHNRGYEYPRTVTSAASDIVVAGWAVNASSYAFVRRLGGADGTERWALTPPLAYGGYGGIAAAGDAAGNVFVTGAIDHAADLGGGELPFGGKRDFALARYDADGTHAWSQSFGGVTDEYGYSIAVHGDDVIAVANGDETFFVRTHRLADGVLESTRAWNGYYRVARHLAVAAQGQMAVAGRIGPGGCSGCGPMGGFVMLLCR